MYKNLLIKIAAAFGLWLLLTLEATACWGRYATLQPFPFNEYHFLAIDHLLRDALLICLFYCCYRKRSSLKKWAAAYFPVLVTGVLYLGLAGFMLKQLSLEFNFESVLAVVTGTFNNIFLVLLAALFYHARGGRASKAVYFAVYFFTAIAIVFDGFYFWQTSMHVESVLFQNLNFYAAKGVLATMSPLLLGGIAVLILLIVLLFRPGPSRGLRESLLHLSIGLFTALLCCNLVSGVLARAALYGVEEAVGLYAEVESEKVRYRYRALVAYPVNVNFAAKALFDSDKRAVAVKERQLTEKDIAALNELGIKVPRPAVPLRPPAYERVVLLILESVHRDYCHHYNPAIPAEATPFLDSLLQKYPHMDRYYASAIPTIQGLNATFRSHLIMDRDMEGRNTPSIFRSLQAVGFRGIFMNASSQYYADELREYPEQYGMKEYYAKEHLEKEGYTGASGWGFHNDVMYEEAVRLLDKHRREKLFLVCKTLDMHQPYPYTGINWNDQPDTVQHSDFATVRGMYWVDKTLEKFFAAVRERGLMDEGTLFIITADHNPHSGGEYTKLVSKPEDRQSIAPIPLLFIGEDLRPFKELDGAQFASQIDLAPTLLHLLGAKVPALFMGRDLLAPAELPYALGYFGGTAFYHSERAHIVDEMAAPVQDKYQDALSNYIVHEYGRWHRLAGEKNDDSDGE